MAYNGSGVFSLPSGNPVVSGTIIASTWANTTLSQIATGLSTAILKDGQQTVTADIPFGTHKLREVSAGILVTDAANVGQIQNSATTYLNNVSGTNTITASFAGTVEPSAWAAGQIFSFLPANNNTAATTLAPGSLAAKSIFNGGRALTGGELIAGVPYQVEYDGTQLNIISSGPFLQSGTNAYYYSILNKLRQAVSILDYKNDDGSWVTGDWNGSTGTNNKTGIQRAYNTGKSVIWPESAGGRRYYVGQFNSGRAINVIRSGQCTFGQDGVSVVAWGNNSVANSGGILGVDSLSGCYSYNLSSESNRTLSERDSPAFLIATCTTGNVNGVGVFGGTHTGTRSPFLAAKTVMDAYEVNNVEVVCTAVDNEYGFIMSNTGNNARTLVTTVNCNRPGIFYGCTNGVFQCYDFHTANLTELSEMVVGVNNDNDTEDICTKGTADNHVIFRTTGSNYMGGPRLAFVTNYTTAQLVLNPAPNNLKIVNTTFEYQDAGSASTTSIGWQYTLDGVNQTSFTGNLWDGIFGKGSAAFPFDLTNQGAHAAVAQTVRGFADFSDLNITIAGASDDPFLSLFYGIPPHGFTNYSATPLPYGSGTAGTPTATTQNLLYRYSNKRVQGTVELAWSGLAGAVGDLRISTGTLGTRFPMTSLANSKAIFPVAASTLTYAGQLFAQILAGTGYFGLFEASSTGTITAVTQQNAGTVIFTFDYSTDN